MLNTAWKFSCNRFLSRGRANRFGLHVKHCLEVFLQQIPKSRASKSFRTACLNTAWKFSCNRFLSRGRANRFGLHVKHCLEVFLQQIPKSRARVSSTAWKFSCNRFPKSGRALGKFSCNRFLSRGRANRFGLHVKHCLEVFLQQIPKSRASKSCLAVSCNRFVLGRALLGSFLATDS